MINQIITWLRRDDQELEWLRRDVEKQEKPMDWDKMHKWLVFIITAAGVMGWGVMIAMWIA